MRPAGVSRGVGAETAQADVPGNFGKAAPEGATQTEGQGQGPASGCIEVFSEREGKQESEGVTPHSWDQAGVL